MIYTNSLSYPNIFSTISGKTMLDTGLEAITRRISLLVQTAYTELFGLPEFGCGLYETTFDYADESTFIIIKEMISEAITKFETSVEVSKDMVEVNFNPEIQVVKITIHYRLKNSDITGTSAVEFGVS